MKKAIERLRVWGCDVDAAMERMADDEDFYIDCLTKTASDPYFDELERTIKAKDVAGAFDTAHTLKGVLANMGLTPMYNIIVDIVEPLRAGSTEDLSDKLSQLIEMKKKLAGIVSESPQ